MGQYMNVGNYRYGLCPRCKNKTMVLDVITGTYTCMACGIVGTTKKNERRKLHFHEDSRIHSLNEAAGRIFTETLFTKYGEKAFQYITQRGLTKETIKEFGLGYASNGKYLRKKLEETGYTQKELVDSGLYKMNDDGTLWFRFTGRIMFMIRDVKGRAIGFSGRVMDKSEPKYKNTPETDVFKKRENLFAFEKAIRSGKNHIILCEGQMDVISMHQAGFKNAVASLGTSLTRTQAEMIRRFTDLAIILYDTDTAGCKATKRGISILENVGVRVYVSNTLPCKDPDEFIQKYGADKFDRKLKESITALEYSIRTAVKEDNTPDYDAICSMLLKNYDLDTCMKTIKKIAITK